MNNSPLVYTDPSGHQAWDGCSGENGGCAGGSNYKDYVFNYLHTDQERQENQEDLEKAVDTVTTVIGVVNEPADWMMTAAYCAAGECSPWVLVGLLPFVPGSAARHADDVIALLPAPKRVNWPWHHLLPRQFKNEFLRRGVNINKHLVSLPLELHKTLHKGASGGPWNDAWDLWLKEHPGATPQDIYKQIGPMIHEFGLDGFIKIVP